MTAGSMALSLSGLEPHAGGRHSCESRYPMRPRKMTPAQPIRLDASPRWFDKLFAGLMVYVVAAATCLLTGFGGHQVNHYLGLLSPFPAGLMSTILLAVTARQPAPGALRSAWMLLLIGLALYIVGDLIGASSWLLGHDPFPDRPTSSTWRSTHRLTGSAVFDPRRSGARAVDAAVARRDHFRGRLRRVLLVPGDPDRPPRQPSSDSSSRL